MAILAIEPEYALRLYDAHAGPVYGALLRVLECEACSCIVLEHAFLKILSVGGDGIRLHQLVAHAFKCCYDGVGAHGREAMRGRIRGWFEGSRSSIALRPLVDSSAPTVLDLPGIALS